MYWFSRCSGDENNIRERFDGDALLKARKKKWIDLNLHEHPTGWFRSGCDFSIKKNVALFVRKKQFSLDKHQIDICCTKIRASARPRKYASCWEMTSWLFHSCQMLIYEGVVHVIMFLFCCVLSISVHTCFRRTSVLYERIYAPTQICRRQLIHSKMSLRQPEAFNDGCRRIV